MSKEIFNGSERRNYVRINSEVPVRFKFCGRDSAKIYAAITKNISHGGMCLEVSQDKDELVAALSSLPQGPIVEVAPTLPDSQDGAVADSAWITSRLDWAKKPGTNESALLMGMNFIEMADSLRQKIYDFVVSEFLRNYNMENV